MAAVILLPHAMVRESPEEDVMVERRPENRSADEEAQPEGSISEETAPPPEPAIPEEPGPEERLLNAPEDTSEDSVGDVAPELEAAAEPPPDRDTSPPSEVPPVVPGPTSAEAPPAPPPPPAAPERVPPSRQRLLRSRDHHVIGGVSGGIAERLDTDPGVVRVLFLVLTLFTAGLAILVYVVLWVVTPLEPANHAAALTDADRSQRAGDRRMGSLVFGLLLVLAGATWLLQETDAVDVDWSVVLAVTLIGLGALLVLTLGRVARGLLVSLGVTLTVALAVVSLVDINFESSFGDRTEEPGNVADLQREYSHAFGSMTLDLRRLELPEGTTEIKASTSFGSLDVILPPDVPVRIEAQTTFGSVDALNNEANGLRADRVLRTEDYDDASQRIDLEVTAAFGSVEVRR